MDNREQSRLRLASARRRLNAFLEQVVELRSSTFPHTDGEEALRLIAEHFASLSTRLDDTDEDTSSAVIDRLCVNVTAQIAKSIVVLGLILRSTNVRNPFELHYALANIVRDAIGGDVRVLVSSEWTYTPFTWPMSIDVLPTFVIIGTPASESSNVLIAPLAGHEIGHTAWQRFSSIKTAAGKAVTPAIEEFLTANPQAEERLLDEFKIKELGRRVAIERCAEFALKQVEEVFCDLFGLYLFGAAYLHAFDYLVAPGATITRLDYPSDLRRVGFLLEAAAAWTIPPSAGFGERWAAGSAPKEHPVMHSVVAAVVERVVPVVRDMLRDAMREKPIGMPDEARIDAVEAAFSRNEPYDGRASLAEIVIAGWRRLMTAGGLAADDDRDRLRVLNDLMLKSIEVAEYKEKTGA